MEKCWLIRTKNKQILGPVTKQKIVEFIDKGSLAPDDEVTSGNGYWISIKENSLVEKYVKGDIPQGFNPISEAPNVLTVSSPESKESTGSLNPNTMPKPEQEKSLDLDVNDNDEINIPDGDDLDYPDMSLDSDDNAQVAPSNEDLEYPDMGTVEQGKPVVATPASSLEEKPKSAPVQMNAHVESQEPGHSEEGKLPDENDLEYPDMGEMLNTSSESDDFDPDATDPNFDMSNVSLQAEDSTEATQDDIVFSEPPQVNESIAPEIPMESSADQVKKKANVNGLEKRSTKSSKTSDKKKKRSKKRVKPQRNDRYLFYVLVLLIGIIVSGAYYYFTNILSSDVVKIHNPFIQSVHAQSLNSIDSKKKTFLN